MLTPEQPHLNSRESIYFELGWDENFPLSALIRSLENSFQTLLLSLKDVERFIDFVRITLGWRAVGTWCWWSSCKKELQVDADVFNHKMFALVMGRQVSIMIRRMYETFSLKTQCAVKRERIWRKIQYQKKVKCSHEHDKRKENGEGETAKESLKIEDSALKFPFPWEKGWNERVSKRGNLWVQLIIWGRVKKTSWGRWLPIFSIYNLLENKIEFLSWECGREDESHWETVLNIRGRITGAGKSWQANIIARIRWNLGEIFWVKQQDKFDLVLYKKDIVISQKCPKAF